MPSELSPLARRLGLKRAPGGGGLLHGTADGVDLVASLTGIGMQAGARAARRMLDGASPDHLLVAGIAGGIGASVAIGDVVVPAAVRDLETGETFRPHPLGRASARGTLASSDRLLERPDAAAALEAEGVIAIDMETAAIAAVCEQRGCPWSVFRAISDRADDGTTDRELLDLVDGDGRPKPLAVARFVLTHPHRIPHLARLARGAHAATRAAAEAAVRALGEGPGRGLA